MTFGHNRPGGRFDAIQTTPEEARRIVDRALDAGITLIDTANVYGDGGSEEVLGSILRGRRKHLVLATKVRGRMGDALHERGLSRRHILEACDASLRRLQTTYIDLYQVHWPDPDVPVDETMRALDDLVQAGKVLYLGASNFGSYEFMKARSIAAANRFTAFVSQQLQYNLLVRTIEEEILPMCRAEGVGIIAFGSLAHGFLSGKYDRGRPPDPESRLARWEHVRQRHDNERDWTTLDEVRRVAAEVGATPSQVAQAWVLAQPGVSSLILGVTNVRQLEAGLAALDVKLGAEHLLRLDAVSRVNPRYPFGGQRRPE
jgi:aryl-alcohol dehydrogenase-like predicted oxidoreductase